MVFIVSTKNYGILQVIIKCKLGDCKNESGKY